MLLTRCLPVLVAALAILGHSSVQAQRPVTLAAPAEDDTFSLELAWEGGTFALSLEDNQTPFRQLTAQSLTRMHAGGNRFLRGSLDGVADSWARLSWIDGIWTGAIFDGQELLILDNAPPGDDGADAAPGTVLYRQSELDVGSIDFGHRCQVDDHGPALPLRSTAIPGMRPHGSRHLPNNLVGDTELFLPITLVSDTQFTARHGGNVLAVAAGRINTIDGVLSASVGVGLLLMHHEILTDNGNLTASNCFDLRQQFQDYFVDGSGSSIPFAGVAHLLTGRTFTGTVGCATSINFGPCSRPFSLAVVMDMPQAWQSIAVLAHELGHNLGAPHDAESGSACAHEPPGRIMAPDGGTSLTYSNCSIDLIQQRLSVVSCLVPSWIFRGGFEVP